MKLNSTLQVEVARKEISKLLSDLETTKDKKLIPYIQKQLDVAMKRIETLKTKYPEEFL